MGYRTGVGTVRALLCVVLVTALGFSSTTCRRPDGGGETTESARSTAAQQAGGPSSVGPTAMVPGASEASRLLAEVDREWPDVFDPETLAFHGGPLAEKLQRVIRRISLSNLGRTGGFQPGNRNTGFNCFSLNPLRRYRSATKLRQGQPYRRYGT